MTKKDIILRVADETNLKQIDVKKVVQKTFDCILDALERGEKIELRNFGVFKIKQRKSRTGRNPRTGQVVPLSLFSDTSGKAVHQGLKRILSGQ